MKPTNTWTDRDFKRLEDKTNQHDRRIAFSEQFVYTTANPSCQGASFDTLYLLDTALSAGTFYLPKIQTENYLHSIILKNTGSNSITIRTTQSINSSTSYTLAGNQSLEIIALKDSYYVISENATVDGIDVTTLDASYTDIWFNGASPKYNTTSQQFQLGFIDEFPGSSLNSRWSTNTGTDGTITVASGLQLQDGTSGTDVTHINTPVLQAFNFEFQYHLTRNASGNSTNAYVGLYENNNIAAGATLSYYIGHNQSATGVKSIIYGEGGSARTAALATDAVWLRMVVNSHGYTVWYNTAKAETSEPGVNDWIIVTAGIQTLVGTFKPNYFICASNAFGAAASNYTIRHLKFRYT